MAVVLGAFRALGLIAALPWGFGPEVLPFKLLLALGLALSAPLELTPAPTECALLLQIALQFLAGFVAGLPLNLAVHAAEMCGELFDLCRGQSLAAFYEPLSSTGQAQSGRLLRGYVLAALVLHGALDGLIAGYQKGFNVNSGNAVAVLRPAHEIAALGSQVMSITLQVCAATFQIFLPVAVSLLALDLALALISKTICGAGVSNEAFMLKTACGVLMALSLLELAPLDGLWRWAAGAFGGF